MSETTRIATEMGILAARRYCESIATKDHLWSSYASLKDDDLKLRATNLGLICCSGTSMAPDQKSTYLNAFAEEMLQHVHPDRQKHMTDEERVSKFGGFVSEIDDGNPEAAASSSQQ